MALSKIQAESMNLADTYAFTGTVTGAGQMVLLQTITASADTEIDFTGHFTSTYKNYELHGTNIHMSGDGNHIGMRYFVGGAIKSDSHYRYTRIRLYSGSIANVANTVVGAVEQTDTDFAMVGGESVGNDTGENTNFKITIFDPLATDNYKMFKAEANYIDLSSDSGQIHSGGHYKNGTNALTGVRIFPNSGNIATGEFKLYGII